MAKNIGFFVAVLSLLLLSVADEAVARNHVYAPPSAIDHSENFQSAFEAMLSDPSNIEKTLRYSRLAVKKGDYESAIPPLERVLIQNPSLSDVRLEVGVLYYLLNSHEIARGYLQDVRNDPSASAELIQRADTYLARL